MTVLKNKKFPLLFLSSVSALVLFSAPAQAQDASVDDVSSMVSSVGAITGVATSVVLGAMGVRLAIKQVNRLTVKG